MKRNSIVEKSYEKKNYLKVEVFWRERKVGEGVILFIRKKNPTCLIRVDAKECYFDEKKFNWSQDYNSPSHEACLGILEK